MHPSANSKKSPITGLTYRSGSGGRFEPATSGYEPDELPDFHPEFLAVYDSFCNIIVQAVIANNR